MNKYKILNIDNPSHNSLPETQEILKKYIREYIDKVIEEKDTCLFCKKDIDKNNIYTIFSKLFNNETKENVYFYFCDKYCLNKQLIINKMYEQV